MKVTYAVVIEPTGMRFSAYVPDLPGGVAATSAHEVVLVGIRAAIQFNLEGLASDGKVAPASSISVEMVSVLVSGARVAAHCLGDRSSWGARGFRGKRLHGARKIGGWIHQT